MALITAGHTVTCADKKRVGGIKQIALANRSEITSYTPATAGAVITAITMAATKKFWLFQMPPETATFTETYEIGEETQSFVAVQSIVMNFGKASQKTAQVAKTLNNACDLVAAVELFNGEIFIVGRVDGLNASEGSATVEASKSGANTVVITLAGRELDPADTYSGTIATLTA